MAHPLAVAATALCAALLLGGCASSAAPGTAAAAQNDHTTAATGFGLGPQNFNSNGGAFGPSQLSR